MMMLGSEQEMDKLREKGKNDLLALSQQYSQKLDTFSGFIQTLRNSKLSSKDQLMFRSMSDAYDGHVKNITTLISELNQYDMYESDEKSAVLEVGMEVVHNTANFILNLPETLARSEFGKTIPDEELMAGIQLPE